ncbi:Semenogelin-2 [Frankliniella fusca]|uniref:Semenogelin-2 n=1 Tax=Frankliniella fusca TaxID=407009 RepID=A0AAE1HMK0_9NEOP|nr:Semenogelin-2 [Frankliniella fusca]
MSYQAEMAEVHRSSQNPNQDRTPDPSGRADRRNARLRLRSKVVGGRCTGKTNVKHVTCAHVMTSLGELCVVILKIIILVLKVEAMNHMLEGRGALLIHNAEDQSGEVNSKEHADPIQETNLKVKKSPKIILHSPCHAITSVSTFTIRNKKTA